MAKTWIEGLKAPERGQADYKVKSFPGLNVRVFASGKRVWFIRGRVRAAGEGVGALKFVQLGEHPGMTREQAEVAAANARDSLRNGQDPNTERNARIKAAQAASKTFGEVVAEWTAERKPLWRAVTTQARKILFNGEKLRPWHDRPIASISAKELKQHAATIAQNTQQSALGPVRSVFKFAAERGYIARSPFVEAGIGVARSEGNASPLVEFREGLAPDFAELVAALNAFDTGERSMPLSPWWDIWRVCILTGQRPSAVIGMRWSELKLDGDAPMWTLPVERSKIKREAKIPLSRDCAALLAEIPRHDSELVWPGRSGKKPLKYPEGESKMVNAILLDRGYPEGWAPGRARDTVASWLEFQSDATERAMAVLLNHKPPADNTRRHHYARISGEHQARVLIERWAQAVREARADAKRERVVPLRKGA